MLSIGNNYRDIGSDVTVTMQLRMGRNLWSFLIVPHVFRALYIYAFEIPKVLELHVLQFMAPFSRARYDPKLYAN